MVLIAGAPVYAIIVIVLAKMAQNMFFTATDLKITGTLGNGTAQQK